MQVKQYHSYFRKAKKQAGIACYLLLCLLLCACANNPAQEIEKTTVSLNNLQKQFDEHLTEWQALQPRLDRLLKSEQDLTFLMNELDKISTLPPQPSKQQLAGQPASTRAVKEPTVKEPAVKKPITAKKTTIEEPAVKKPVTAKEPIAAKKPITLPAPQKKEEVGVHLASYKEYKNLLRGWNIYLHKYPHLLENKKPRTQAVSKNDGNYQRLIIGGFRSTEEALQLCASLKKKQQFCRVLSYEQP